jgi:hypothetical protein
MSTRARRLLFAVLAALILSLPAPALAAQGMELALQDDKVFLQDQGPGVERGLTHARRLGVTTIKAILVWTPGSTFPEHDRLLAAAAARGMRVQFDLTAVPAWGGSTRITDTTRPSRARFASFAYRVARHFRGRVARYSIWNEPNWHTWLQPARRAPSSYRGLYVAARNAIVRADPAVPVLLGELAPHENPPWSIGPLAFLRRMSCQDRGGRALRRCPPLKADGVALHPYEFLHPPEWRGPHPDSVTIGTLGRLTRELRRLARRRALIAPGGRPPPVYLTEFAYFASGDRSVPSRTRARWLARAYDIALAHPRVRQMTLFGLLQTPSLDSWNVGVLTRRGRRDASYRTLERWAVRRARAGQIAAPLLAPFPG